MRRLPRDILLPAVAGLLLVAVASVLPPQLHGDVGEYLLMLESFAGHGSPELQPQDVTALRESLRESGLSLDEGRILPAYRRGSDGRLYCYHFWGYSLSGLPARQLLDVLGLDPLRALPVTNAVLFALALVSLGLLPWSPGRRVALTGLLLFSPALAFLLWPHPEVFSFALVAAALSLAAAGRRALGVLAAALGSVQNPPLAVLAGLLWIVAVAEGVRRGPAGGAWGRARAVMSPSLAALPVVLPAAFFWWQFGVLNLSVRPNEAAQSLSFIRGFDLVVDPNLGVLPHAPVTLLLALCGALVAFGRAGSGVASRLRGRSADERTSHDAAQFVLVFGLLPLLMYACTANSNWNNDTSGPSRYVVWLFPILAFAAAAETGGPAVRRPGRVAMALLGLAVATQAAVALARGGPLAPSDFLQHSTAARFVLDHAPGLYSPEPLVFVERTLGHEGPFQGPVIYRDAAGRCRKAWLQWRHARALVDVCGPPPGETAARLQESARRPDLKRQWTYVNY